jgi:UMF1 family MFS transporter|tara:strand:+ start:319 stop:1545 length:1227 start_codon:yes stop_codon:yes gene_type:complete
MKKVFNFALYDFANSAFTTIIITFIFATYFAKQIAPNTVLGQSYWGWTIGLVGFLVAIAGPFIGSFADKKNKILFFLRFFSLLCIFFTSLLWFAKPFQNYLLYTLVIVGIANFFYELSLIFYNSLLKDISKSKNLGKSSGLGFALGYIGGIATLFISIKLFIDNDNLPFGLSKEESQNIRATAILVSAWFLLFSSPFLFFFKKKLKKINKSALSNFSELKNLIWNRGLKTLGKFLIARMLYADGLNAIIVMGGIFAVGVFNLQIKELLILSVLMNITAFIGAFVGGLANDKYGSKIVIITSLLGLIFSSSVILFVYSKQFFFIMAAINGLFIGPIQSASRVMITSLLDNNNQGKGFGLFATSGKLTSFIGPLLVSTVTFLSDSQRIGFSSAIVLLVAGLVILINIRKI